MLKRVLIANRGEIASRIARTCDRLRVEYVGVYSDADRGAAHLAGAAATVHLGPSAPSASYLDAGKLLEAARQTGCDSVHPGYGFLSENAGFARAATEAGLAFIGPRAETIETLGDKARSKDLMRAAGVPTVPGSAEATQDIERIRALAAQIGFPVLLKPSAGGGGKGMQVVGADGELREAAEQAMRIAHGNFGDARLLVESFIDRPRHIEVQIFGDHQGSVVHLFERECSLQRRHQKVIEEAPAACLAPAARAALLEAAVRGARAVGYVNAGTFEFILAPTGEFYFLEVNTRLQVEHPVSEEITGLDFVEWQLRVAAGEPLPLSQDAIHATGHAIECRLYAEDPSCDFRPAPGPIAAVRWPSQARIETGIASGGEVSSYYDPMVAKLVVHAADRNAAMDRALAALEETAVVGLTTNLGFLAGVLSDPAVRANDIDTRFLDRNVERFHDRDSTVVAPACAAIMALGAGGERAPAGPWQGLFGGGVFDRVHLDAGAPWGTLPLWREESLVEARIAGPAGGRGFHVLCGDRMVLAAGRPDAEGVWSGQVDGRAWYAAETADAIEVQVAGSRSTFQRYDRRGPGRASDGAGALATMPGIVAALPVAIGDRVASGDTLAIVEAMKMETRIVAAFGGRVAAVHCTVGDSVRAGEILVSVDAG